MTPFRFRVRRVLAPTRPPDRGRATGPGAFDCALPAQRRGLPRMSRETTGNESRPVKEVATGPNALSGRQRSSLRGRRKNGASVEHPIAGIRAA